MISHLSSAAKIFLVAVTLFFCSALYVYLNRASSPTSTLDSTVKKALNDIGMKRAYASHVETTLALPDREVRVDGVYVVNEPLLSYESFSTTTVLFRPGNKVASSFTLANISIASDVYSKIFSLKDSPAVIARSSSSWKHFTKDSILLDPSSVAVSGPILDNFLIFSSELRHLLFRTSHESTINKIKLMQHVFSIQKTDDPNLPATLSALITRIGEKGYVSVWMSPTSSSVIFFSFDNDSYHSTTTPLFDSPLPSILKPISSE